MPELTIFYDSECPLCVYEMQHLQGRDQHRRLAFEDIHQADFSTRFAHINPASAMAQLHGERRDGRLLLGLDVTACAWALVGVSGFKLLRWPLIRPLADFAYRLFARHRYRISRWLTGRARCNRCQITHQPHKGA